MNRVGSYLLGRKNPMTTEEIASRVGVARKTVQNSLASNEVDNWLPYGQSIVVLHDGRDNSKRYCIRDSEDATSDSLRYRNQNYRFAGFTANGNARFVRK